MTTQIPVRPTEVAPAELSLRRTYVLRVGYLMLGGGLVAYKWPLLLRPEPPMTAVVTCLLAGMSIVALLGLRYPERMLPILLFEVAWKLIWLAAVALPLWLGHNLDAANRELLHEILWVVPIIAVVPWRYAYQNYLLRPAERWR